MPYATRQDDVKEKRKSHSFTPYNLDERRSKTTSSGWTPSIWNALTFWKSGGASSEEVEEKHEEEENAVNCASSITHDATNDEKSDRSVDNDTQDSSLVSSVSEAQISAHLSLEPQRHVHFKLPKLDQTRLNSHRSQESPETTLGSSIGQNSIGNYVAPLPPSSPLRDIVTPQQDPLLQVVEFISSRDGRPINHVEALGLNSLLQQSVYQSERPTAARHHLRHLSSPVVLASSATSSSISPSPPSISPTFIGSNIDFISSLTSSSAASAPHAQPSPAVNGVSPTPTAPPNRTLTRNPNGTLYYQGGGSARSRYRSSAFSGSPTRKKVAFPRDFGETPKTKGSICQTDTPSPSDGKRRRVGEDRESSIVLASGSTIAKTNGSVTRTSNTPPEIGSLSLRFGMPLPGSRFLATTPARPSPLRQSIRAESSSPSSASPGSVNGGSPRTRDTDAESPPRARGSGKASEIMAGIINDATPKKDSIPDIRNPYQANHRSPTKRTRKSTAKAPRPPPRPLRSYGPPPPQPKKLSALETIQRTAPQVQTGSKRSYASMLPSPPKLPAANGIHVASGSENPGLSAQKPITIELDEDEDQSERPPKKQRQENGVEGAGTERQLPTIEIEDLGPNGSATSSTEKTMQLDEVVESGTERSNQPESKRPFLPAPSGKKIPTGRFQNVPKDPSPLRQSFQPEIISNLPKDTPSISFSAPTPSLASTSGFVPPATTSAFALSPAISASPSVSPTRSSAEWLLIVKQQALDAPVNTLPTFVFAFTSGTVISNVFMNERNAALATPINDLPKFDLFAAPTPKVEVRGFDYQAAGLKLPETSGWRCELCSIRNDNDVATCQACETPR